MPKVKKWTREKGCWNYT